MQNSGPPELVSQKLQGQAYGLVLKSPSDSGNPESGSLHLTALLGALGLCHCAAQQLQVPQDLS